MIAGGNYGGYLAAMALTYSAEFLLNVVIGYSWFYSIRIIPTIYGLPNNPKDIVWTGDDACGQLYQNYRPSMLLLQHGAMNDNVHIQNAYQLAITLQKCSTKPFELMVYPGQRHGFLGPKSTLY